jgi:peptidoglycan/LPS O-acetylase OafA/YrhL
MESRAENSYDFVRFCAASAVLFSHHFALAGFAEPPVPGYGEDFGKLGVEVFFCLSGFLICRSLQKTSDWAQFVSARFLRIFPNLTFALVTTSLVTLVWYHNYDNVWPHAKYVIRNLLMFVKGVTWVIPGVFTDVRDPVINGPLWSLVPELWMYTLLFAICVLDGRARATGIVFGALLFSIAWGAAPIIGEHKIGPLESFQFFRLGSFFLSGAALAVWWPQLRRHAMVIGVVALIAVPLARNFLPFETVLHSLAVAAAVIGLGSSSAVSWFSRGGDASYGMYIFAWPVQKFCLLLIGTFWLSMLTALLLTAAIGYGTWHGFERQAMRRRNELAERLRRLVLWSKTSSVDRLNQSSGGTENEFAKSKSESPVG